MAHISKTVWAALLCTALSPAVAAAQQKCPEGRAAGGACANPGLIAAARQTAIIFAQPKISQTAYPVLPTEDPRFRLLQQLGGRDRPITGPAASPIP
jgi:hypothetical protein